MEEMDYKQLIENSPSAFAYHRIIVDQNNKPIDYVFLDANEKFEEITGLKREEIINKRVTEVIPEIEEDQFDWIDFYGEIALKGGSSEFEQYCALFNKWYKIKAFSPKKNHFVTFFNDIENEMKITAFENYLDSEKEEINYQTISEKMREISGAKYSFFNIYDKSEELVKTVSIAGNFEHVERAASLIGVELIGWKWEADLLKEEKVRKNKISRFASLSDITGDILPVKLIKALEKIFSLGNIYIVKIARGEDIIGYFVLVMDEETKLANKRLIQIYTHQLLLLFERQKNQKKLNRTKERLKLAMEAAEHSFWDWDLDSNKVYFSPRFYNMLGYKAGELSTGVEDLIELLHPQIRKRIKTDLREAVNNTEQFEKEIRVKNSEGKWKWFQLSGKTYELDDNNVPHRVVGVLIDIDKRKRQEEQLEKSRRQFTRLAEEAPIGILSCDLHGNITYLNSKISEILGSPSLEATKEINLLDFPPLKDKGVSKKIESCMRTNIPGTYELNYTTKWNKNIWVRIHISPQLERGEVKGAQIIMDDITEKRKMQERLKSSEKNFRTFFETVDDLITVGNYEGKILYTNSAVSDKLGYSRDELKEMHILDVHPDNKQQAAKEILNDMFEGKRDICPLPLARKDGSLLPVETKVWFGEWDGEEVIFAISKDLSRQQEALQKFNKLFENNPALMAVSTIPDGKFLEVNNSFLEKLGYEEEEIIGKSSLELDLFVKPDRQRLVSENLVENGKISNKELRVRTKDGKILDGLFSGEIIESQGKKYFLTVMTDITDQKNAEKELVKTNQKLKESIKKANEMAERAERANRLKSQFLANMSHEIRTPLNIIMGYTEILTKEFNDHEHRRYIKSIRSAGESLLDQVNDILDMSKIEAGMIDLSYEFIDLKELLNELVAIFSDRVESKELDFIVNIDQLPEQIKLDESRFRQIIINLLDNAFKFTKEGFVSLDVVNTGRENEGGVIGLQIIVEDSGIGIKEDKKSEIFNAFSQQDGQSTREYGGTGLGLSITKRLINMMGGTISLQSSEGVGSKFIVDFPHLEYKAQKRNKEKIEPAEFECNFRGAKILVVDDEELNRELLKIKLGDKKVEVIEAANGEEAIELTKEEKPDLILMDLKMPVMDGYQAYKEIRKLENIDEDLPVIALTAAATENEQQMSAQTGFSDFISKPLVEGRLYELLNNYLADN